MIDLFIPSLVSFLITFLTTPFVISLANRFGLIDDPRIRPHPAHVQKRVVPRAGGLPIFLGLTVSILLFVPIDKHILGIIIGMLVLLAAGLLDDILVDFSPYLRLLLQVLAAVVVVISGVGITFITNPFGGILRLDLWVLPINFFGIHHIVVIADFLALIWIVWMQNMVNWSKGVDGQMPGIMTVAALTLGFLSTKLYLNGDVNQYYIAILSFITAGASLGLLIFNWHPAKIFPGFSGSTILGFMIATLSILSGAKLATALLVLLIPAIDFIYTFFRRILAGTSPLIGDQFHLHHLLLKRGLTHQQISLFYITSCAILGLTSTNLSTQGKLFTVLVVGVVVFGGILWLHSLRQKE